MAIIVMLLLALVLGGLAGFCLSNLSIFLLMVAWAVYFVKVRKAPVYGDFGRLNKDFYSFVLVLFLAVTILVGLISRLPIWAYNWFSSGSLFFR